MATIHHIAAEFERVFPDDVDRSKSGNGEQEAGYRGFDAPSDKDPYARIGYYCSGGNCGEPVCQIHDDSIDDVYRMLSTTPADDERFASTKTLLAALVAGGCDVR